MARLLLCRPQGGLNDLLSQVEKCARYAERTGRTLIVDTNYKSSAFFKDDFSEYFVSRQRRLILGTSAVDSSLEQLRVFPEALSGRVNSYEARQNLQTHQFCDADSGLPLTFDFAKDYPHQVLVHQQAGGSRDSVFSLLRMTLQNRVADELVRRVTEIGGAYAAIHIRHTDYQTDYEHPLASLAQASVDRLFVATDNRQVIEDFCTRMGRGRIFSFSALPQSAGQPAQTLDLSEADRFRRNQDAIIDLLMLALSRQLHLLPLKQNRFGTKYSGFSVLAHQLWSSKTILKHLLSRPDLRFGLD